MTPFKKIFYILIGALLIGMGVYGAAFYHLYTIERSSNELSREVSRLTRTTDEQLSLRTLGTEIRDDIEVLEAAVVKKDAEVEIIGYIENLARSNNTYISILSVSEQQGEPLNNLNFKIVAEGSWNQIMTLLAKMERMQYLPTIHKVELEKIDAVQRYDANTSNIVSQTGRGDVLPAVVRRSDEGPRTPGWRLASDFSLFKEK